MEYISIALGAGNLILLIIMFRKINKTIKKAENYFQIIMEDTETMGTEEEPICREKRTHKLSESEQNRILSEVLEEVFAGKILAK